MKIKAIIFFSLAFLGLHAELSAWSPFPTYTHEIYAGGGAGVLSPGGGKPAAGHGYFTANYTYYFRPSSGFGGGLVYAPSFDSDDRGIKALYELPLFYSYRGGVSTQSDKENVGGQASTTNEAVWGIISYILPTNFGFKVGPNIGVFQGDKNLSYSGGYKIKHQVALSLDAEPKLSYVFGPVKLSISAVVGYSFINNLVYVDRYSRDNGVSPHFRFRIQGGLSFSFY